MGLGTELMRFFALDNVDTNSAGQIVSAPTLQDFATQLDPQAESQAPIYRAAERLAEDGHLLHLGSGQGVPAFSARYASMKTVDEMALDFDYGGYDFIVDGRRSVVAHFLPSVVHLVGRVPGKEKPANGTAFVVGHPRVLMTAKHCVVGVEELAIELPQGSGDLVSIEFEPIVSIPGDVALLVMSEPVSERPFRIANDVHTLDDVVTIGFPTLAGLNPTPVASYGSIAGRTHAYIDNGHEYLVTTCAMTGGSSGGPVVRSDGLLVGVVSAFSKEDELIDPGRFGLACPALPAATILGALKSVFDGVIPGAEVIAAFGAAKK